jgi:hypothetical protein
MWRGASGGDSVTRTLQWKHPRLPTRSFVRASGWSKRLGCPAVSCGPPCRVRLDGHRPWMHGAPRALPLRHCVHAVPSEARADPLRSGLPATSATRRRRTERPWRFRAGCWTVARCARVSSWLQKLVGGVRSRSPVSWPTSGTGSSAGPHGSERTGIQRSAGQGWRKEEPPERAPGQWKAFWTVESVHPSRDGQRKRSWSGIG